MQDAIDVISSLQIAGRIIAYHPLMGKALGSTTCGIFLSQFLYWEGRQSDPERWIYKRMADITEETGLSRTEQETVRRKLRELTILEEARRGTPARLFFRFNWDLLNRTLLAYYKKHEMPERKPQVPPPLPAASAPIAGAVKARPVVHRMHDLFDVYNNILFPELPYKWLPKDWGKIADIEKLLRDMTLNRKQGTASAPATVTDDDVVDAFQIILEEMPSYYKEKQFTPSGIYSNINPILRAIRSSRTNGKSNEQGPGLGGFADRARAHQND